uniref:GA22058 n=1 Tax=Drosophila miranda TaxID=7229 RepID=D0QWN9_DROMI|nr:GA22058 [Drosophila miranda]
MTYSHNSEQHQNDNSIGHQGHTIEKGRRRICCVPIRIRNPITDIHRIRTHNTLGGGGAFFFANNNGSASKRNGGRSPQGMGMVVRQSPATILGGGFSPPMAINGGSARKQRKSPPTIGAFGASPQQQHPLIPTALTHFAGSKCFDAPAPTALPKPPQHWTLSKSEEKLASSAGPALQSLMRSGGEYLSSPRFHLGGKSSKRNLLDDFDTHNLKLLLNVQS